MRQVILICLLFIVSGEAGVSAQKTRRTPKKTPRRVEIVSTTEEPTAPPPVAVPTAPPPVATAAEKVNPADFANGMFTSEAGGFKVAFTALPVKTTREINSAFGKAKVTIYLQPTGFATYNITYIDFPAEITSLTEKKIRYDGVRDKLIENLKARLMSEKEVYFGDNYGKEYTIESEASTYTSRLYLIKQRFFQLSVITNGQLSKLSEESRQFNQEKINKFLNSFTVTQLPAIQATATELPENFGISIDKSVFKSDYFKFTAPLPENWYVLQKEEANAIIDLGKQKINSSLPDKKDETQLSVDNTRMLLILTKSEPDKGVNEATLMMAAEKISFPNFVSEEVIKSYLADSEKLRENITTPIAKINLGGKDFAWCETENPVTGTKKRFFISNAGGIAFEILLLYKNQPDLDLMLDSLSKSRFENAVTN